MFDYQGNALFSAFHCIAQAAFTVDSMSSLGVWTGTSFGWLLRQFMIHLKSLLFSCIAVAGLRLAFVALPSYSSFTSPSCSSLHCSGKLAFGTVLALSPNLYFFPAALVTCFFPSQAFHGRFDTEKQIHRRWAKDRLIP